jgi:transposase
MRGLLKMDEHIKTMLPLLNEREKRIFLASIASEIGRGGVKYVCEVSGVSPHTVIKGKQEIIDGVKKNARQRAPGGGRKKTIEKIPQVWEWIKESVNSATYGNPENPLSWTTKSLDRIQSDIFGQHQEVIGRDVIARLLKENGYSLQRNQKMLQVGESHIDRDSQFAHINSEVKTALEQGIPAISIDTKKKEKIGNFKNEGQEYRPKHNARKVLDHDFPIPELGKVAPYGVYTLNNNKGFVNLGTSHDTPNFAVDSIFAWWETVGAGTFPKAEKLLITSDCGGSNNYRSRAWIMGLQELGDKTRLKIAVCHFPPGTSKWNKIEHRMFCYISKNWRGKPLIDIMTVINLIGSTTTKTGLEIICKVSYENYPLGVKISDEDFQSINITRNKIHGEWNYIISPR